ncbi:MAG: hypothetical protein AAGC60_20865 [Acidobacteriota bacterium]
MERKLVRCLALAAVLLGARAAHAQAPTSAEELRQAPVYRSLVEALSEPDRVYRLDLRDDRELTALPPEIARLVHLQELNLQDTRIAGLPAEMGRLRSLRHLSLQHLGEPLETLRALPPEIGELDQLETVNLIGLPNLDFAGTFKILARLPRLRNLPLMNNRLRTLPEEVRGLRGLEMIWLGRNPDLDLANTFTKLANLPKLRQLGLAGNRHRSLPPELGELKALRHMWLAGNRLETWRETSAPELTSLVFKDNQLTRLPASLTGQLRLESLSLATNPDLDLGHALPVLGRLEALQHLDLRDCDLSALPEDLAPLRRLKELDLRGNALPDRERLRLQKSLADTKIHF